MQSYEASVSYSKLSSLIVDDILSERSYISQGYNQAIEVLYHTDEDLYVNTIATLNSIIKKQETVVKRLEFSVINQSTSMITTVEQIMSEIREQAIDSVKHLFRDYEDYFNAYNRHRKGQEQALQNTLRQVSDYLSASMTNAIYENKKQVDHQVLSYVQSVLSDTLLQFDLHLGAQNSTEDAIKNLLPTSLSKDLSRKTKCHATVRQLRSEFLDYVIELYNVSSPQYDSSKEVSSPQYNESSQEESSQQYNDSSKEESALHYNDSSKGRGALPTNYDELSNAVQRMRNQIGELVECLNEYGLFVTSTNEWLSSLALPERNFSNKLVYEQEMKTLEDDAKYLKSLKNDYVMTKSNISLLAVSVRSSRLTDIVKNLVNIEEKIDSVIMQPLKEYITAQRNMIIDLYTTALNMSVSHAAYFEEDVAFQVYYQFK